MTEQRILLVLVLERLIIYPTCIDHPSQLRRFLAAIGWLRLALQSLAQGAFRLVKGDGRGGASFRPSSLVSPLITSFRADQLVPVPVVAIESRRRTAAMCSTLPV